MARRSKDCAIQKRRDIGVGLTETTMSRVLAKSDERIRMLLDTVVDSLSNACVVHLRTEYMKHRSSIGKPEEWSRLAESIIPVALERAFVSELLSSEDSARQRRALLSHLLSIAELKNIKESSSGSSPYQRIALNLAEAVSEAEYLTCSEAAKLLHVSRTHLDQLVAEGRLAGVRDAQDSRRRIPRAVVLDLEKQIRSSRKKGLARMMEATERAGLYDVELQGLPERRKG